MESQVIEWDAPEYHHVDRSPDWFWMLGIISVSLAVLCILFGNILFGLLILVGALSAGMYAAREPKMAHFELQPKGILAGKVFYEFTSLDSFWVDEDHALPRIILKSQKMFMPHIIVPIADEPQDDIKEYLVTFLPEVHHEESFAHKWFEHIGL